MPCWDALAASYRRLLLQGQEYTNTNSNLDEIRWQKNRFQTKEEDKTRKEELSKVEIGNLPKKEFRVMIIMTKELRFTEQEVTSF